MGGAAVRAKQTSIVLPKGGRLPSAPPDEYYEQAIQLLGDTEARTIFESTRPRYLVERVEDECGRLIVSRALGAGALLTPDMLPHAIGDVSRPIWREAMQLLAMHGLVRAVQRKGVVVMDAAAWNLLDAKVLRWHSQTGHIAEIVEDLAEVRRMIEPFAAARAAERASMDEIACLYRALEGVEGLVAGEHRDLTAGIYFHAGILKASGNRVIHGMVPILLHALYAIYRGIPVQEAAALIGAEMVRHLRAVVDAIANREPHEAERAMNRAINKTNATYLPSAS
ncbi:FadR/GntR family transcriptional regulator [Acuticoccus kandeliae]|uniref:FadR/GntR family transcriptional regulator n=1 Tax=Acuticoccus kandeliae TaxID=2073160 RepID=UPI000D3E639C|nr:FCD domain-containing protein [Acuticoccus kandeliae]